MSKLIINFLSHSTLETESLKKVLNFLLIKKLEKNHVFTLLDKHLLGLIIIYT